MSQSVRLLAFFVPFFVATRFLVADGPADNNLLRVRQVPPAGIQVSEEQRTELEASLKQIDAEFQDVLQSCETDDRSWFADVAVLTRSVRLALDFQTFYDEKDFEHASNHLQLARTRLDAVKRGSRGVDLLKAGQRPRDEHWLLVGGFVSRIDGAVQPYGLVIPTSLAGQQKSPQRLDVWLHGRGEKELELQFLAVRQSNKGYFAPSNAIVLHPFGRYSNAFRFAGETDVFEAINHVEEILTVDQQRISIRGFSMGGAGCWQFAVHYPGYWMAATPGAGFSETLGFLKGFQGEEFSFNGMQADILNWYDCPPWVSNLRNLPTIAYSGELDRQKQAADVMVAAARNANIDLPHIIGPQTEHRIHPESQSIIADKMDEWSRSGKPVTRRTIDFTTYTLRYPQCDWVRVTGLVRHWSPSRVQAELSDNGSVFITTSGISHLELTFTSQQTESVALSGDVKLDSSQFHMPSSTAGEPYVVEFERVGEGWRLAEDEPVRRKRPGLQGPIDDAFSDSFVLVRPSRPCVHGAVQRWVSSEMAHFQNEWKRHFRGEVRVVDDAEIDAEVIRESNLILFGDTSSNRLLSRIAQNLPITWTRDKLAMHGVEYPVESTVIALIYPNPLNPKKYIVINSGFTYREYSYLNNARQISHLPDWAVLDISKGSNTQLPGDILRSGFFDEHWE